MATARNAMPQRLIAGLLRLQPIDVEPALAIL
jgi:hypothetical protein